jgi:hypothetical protein
VSNGQGDAIMLKFWPIAAFLMIQTGSIIWWAATTSAEIDQLKDGRARIEHVIEDLPDMKATLKNVERLVLAMQSDGGKQKP